MKFLDIPNLKIKMISLLYGFVCHSTFFLAGFSMVWVLYNGFTVSLGSLRYPFNFVSNLFLLIQFPIFHSFLLSNRGRKFLRLLAPKDYAKILETTIYATIASIQLIFLFLLWTPTNIIIYEIVYPYNIINCFLFIFSWILLSISSYQAGVEVQTGSLGWTSMFLLKKPQFPSMPVHGLFKLVRHPIYLSFCLVLWTPPTMTLDLFLVAFIYSFYCYFSPRLKERRFAKFYGDSFLTYKRNTPYFFPTLRTFLRNK